MKVSPEELSTLCNKVTMWIGLVKWHLDLCVAFYSAHTHFRTVVLSHAYFGGPLWTCASNEGPLRVREKKCGGEVTN